MYETFIDLDELIVRCRDKQAKKFIQEAVACYRSGTFRSCIVATWNAVVFDFLHKLRELELLGDGEASSLLKDFENKSSASTFKELWQFESNIPELALTKFELISAIEKVDIKRLFEDRSRCAHPSMTSLEEPFEATAELARYHLRSAVMHLLQRPPVQGRSALERIFQDIKSEYFPVDPEFATKYFQKSPLARARSSLIKDIVRGLTVNLLTAQLPENERTRQFSALNAVSTMYPKETGEILNTHLSNIILKKVVDTNWDKVIIYLGSVTAWESLSEPCQLKAKSFIEKLDIFDTSRQFYQSLSHQNVNILLKASCVDFLKEFVSSKLQQVSLKDLLSIKEICKNRLFNETVINPLLRDAVPQATLNQLISIRLNTDEALNGLVEPYLQESIKGASLEKIVSVMSRYEDESLNRLIEPCLREKITNASLNELLVARLNYVSVNEPSDELTDFFDSAIGKQIKEVSFDDLLQLKYWDALPEELLNPILKENVSAIVDKFMKSGSFASANTNANLIVKIADFISPVQWNYILEAFWKNDQIYGSFDCLDSFCSLFKKSVKLSDSVQPYWLSFQEKLNKFNNVGIDRLKQLIDSYSIVEEA
ncbi:MAG: hypothetical protein KME05_24565 [Gloeocapsa sp. UFS-A4-WI-NPMV-4B04]|jgi:hypothetical protein|nr:hypothetical protein [Gloeocapsa sp. UFS-A4-WI-NPMV-4B04]